MLKFAIASWPAVKLGIFQSCCGLSSLYNVDLYSKDEIRREEEYVDAQLRRINLFDEIGGYDISHRMFDWFSWEARVQKEKIEGMLSLISEVTLGSSSFDMSYLCTLNRIIRENAICGDCDPSERKHILREYYLEKERLEKRREELRSLRKMKTARVSNMIRAAWLNRNTAVGRSSTSSVTDTMLLSIPTPPTFKAANRSLVVGGAVIAFR